MNNTPIKVELFFFAGKFGPFKVKIPCGECTLTEDVIKDTLASELAGISVEFTKEEWLTNWWKPLKRGGWHAPIVIVDGKVISQGVALNRGVLTEAIMYAYAKRTTLKGNHLFGKDTCPYCAHAKEVLHKANIPFEYHNVIKNPRDLYEMLGRVKPIIGSKTPVTVPQIWLDGEYVGGSKALDRKLKGETED